MITQEEAAQVVTYCYEINISHKQRLEGFETPAYQFYDANANMP